MSSRLIKNILTCSIQIILKIDDKLSSHYNQVLNGTYKFPDYSNCCPICHGKECAVRHGYYFRQVIDESGTFYKSFPIARYLCQRKGKAKLSARTFSLLAWQLIPYRKWTIELMFSIASYRSEHSIKESLDKFEIETTAADLVTGIKKVILSNAGQFTDIEEIILSGLEKVKISRMISFDTSYSDFITYCRNYVSESAEKIRGPTILAWDYYIKQGGYYENSQFLFGCAAQFC